MKQAITEYFLNVFIALSQLLNAVLAGLPDESFSARSYRKRKREFWDRFRAVIDGFFYVLRKQEQHCFDAYIAEMKRRQLPEEYRK